MCIRDRQKAIRSLEQGRLGFALGSDSEFLDLDLEMLWHRCEVATPERLFALHEVMWRGASIDEVVQRTRIDRWFIHQLAAIIERERELHKGLDLASLDRRGWLRYKQWGFSDPQIANLTDLATGDVTRLRRDAGVDVYKRQRVIFERTEPCPGRSVMANSTS